MSTVIGTGARATARAAWLTWCAGVATGLAVLAPIPAWAEPGAPAVNQVVGYAAADRSGATTSWTLAEGAPYLFVPYVGAEVSGSVAAVETGADVGAVLFQRPYFGSHDAGCTPELGSDARPDLKWRGATARFSPPVETEAGTPTGAEHFASLIVYRKDLGPPPGALLLNRRLTLGSPCRQGVHKTLFDRVFIPLAAPPEPVRCYNLSSTYPQSGGKDIKVDFASADRLSLLQPADLDDRYRTVRHRFRVTLYDGKGCRGGAGEFRSEGKEPGDIKLDPVGLRNRVRSVRIIYEGGTLAPYYVVPAAAPVAEAPVAEVPVVEAPVVEAPVAEMPVAEVPVAEVPVADKSPAPQPAAPAADTATEPAGNVAAPAPPSQPTAPPSDSVMAKTTPVPPPAKSDEPALARPQTAAIPLYVALPAPRLTLPPARPAAPAPTAASLTFEYPVHEIYRLNFCLRWGEDCGEPAATAWCQAQGFAKAGAWKIDKNIGSLFPTIVLADKRICAQFPCDGFEEITCSN